MEELVEVCRDYCWKVWAETLNLVGVPATSGCRKAENIYYPPNIHKVPVALLPPTAPASTSSEQPSITQASLPPPEVPKGLGKASDQSQGVEVAKGKEAGQGRVRLRIRAKARKLKLR